VTGRRLGKEVLLKKGKRRGKALLAGSINTKVSGRGNAIEEMRMEFRAGTLQFW